MRVTLAREHVTVAAGAAVELLNATDPATQAGHRQTPLVTAKLVLTLHAIHAGTATPITAHGTAAVFAALQLTSRLNALGGASPAQKPPPRTLAD
jgi:hypothetical protein